MLQKTLIYIQKKLGFLDLMSPEWHEVLSYFYNSHSLKYIDPI